jgi:hypothetical protein
MDGPALFEKELGPRRTPRDDSLDPPAGTSADNGSAMPELTGQRLSADIAGHRLGRLQSTHCKEDPGLLASPVR